MPLSSAFARCHASRRSGARPRYSPQAAVERKTTASPSPSFPSSSAAMARHRPRAVQRVEVKLVHSLRARAPGTARRRLSTARLSRPAGDRRSARSARSSPGGTDEPHLPANACTLSMSCTGRMPGTSGCSIPAARARSRHRRNVAGSKKNWVKARSRPALQLVPEPAQIAVGARGVGVRLRVGGNADGEVRALLGEQRDEFVGVAEAARVERPRRRGRRRAERARARSRFASSRSSVARSCSRV